MVVECEHIYKPINGHYECMKCGKRTEWDDFNREWK